MQNWSIFWRILVKYSRYSPQIRQKNGLNLSISRYDPPKSDRLLARISHQLMAAGAHLPESTALGSDKGLDILYSTPARFVSLAPCISGYLHALAPRSGEKSGLRTPPSTQ